MSGEQGSGRGFKKPSLSYLQTVTVAMLLCALRVTDGFKKDAVASLVD